MTGSMMRLRGNSAYSGNFAIRRTFVLQLKRPMLEASALLQSSKRENRADDYYDTKEAIPFGSTYRR
jgi:hypothetical protein